MVPEESYAIAAYGCPCTAVPAVQPAVNPASSALRIHVSTPTSTRFATDDRTPKNTKHIIIKKIINCTIMRLLYVENVRQQRDTKSLGIKIMPCFSQVWRTILHVRLSYFTFDVTAFCNVLQNCRQVCCTLRGNGIIHHVLPQNRDLG